MTPVYHDGRLFLFGSDGRPWHMYTSSDGTAHEYQCGICGEKYSYQNDTARKHETCSGLPCTSCGTSVWMIHAQQVEGQSFCSECLLSRSKLLAAQAPCCEVCDTGVSRERLLLKRYDGDLGTAFVVLCPGCVTTMQSRPTLLPTPRRYTAQAWHGALLVATLSFVIMLHLVGVW